MNLEVRWERRYGQAPFATIDGKYQRDYDARPRDLVESWSHWRWTESGTTETDWVAGSREAALDAVDGEIEYWEEVKQQIKDHKGPGEISQFDLDWREGTSK